MTKMFSIIVPVYRVEKYIIDCIQSILNQSFPDFELIIVDDKTDDNSIGLIQEYIKQDKRIKIIRHRKNKGLGEARNSGLKYAKGKYILCVDSDDWISPNCLQVLYDTIQKYPSLNVIWFKYSEFDDNLKQGCNCSYSDFKFESSGFKKINENNIHWYPVTTWNKVYKTSFLKKNNITWPSHSYYEDVEFYYKVHLLCKNIYLINQNLYVYRIRNQSIMQNSLQDYTYAKDVFKILYKLFALYKKKKIFDKYKKSYFAYLASNIQNLKRRQVLYYKNKNQIREDFNQLLEKIQFYESKK